MDLWLMFLTIMAGGALCIYLFGEWEFEYFKKLGIPHKKPIPIFGNVFPMFARTKPMTYVMHDIYKSHPDAKYFGFYEFSTPKLLVTDPELIKSIGIKNFDSFPNHKTFLDAQIEPLFDKNLFALKDDEWKNMRTLLSPAFTSSKMKIMFEILSQCAIKFSDHLAKLNPQPEAMEMKETFGRYTLDVIASAAFGLTVNSMEDPNNEFYQLGKSVANFSLSKMMIFFALKNFSWLIKLLGLRFLDRKSSEFFTDVIRTTIATRDAQGIVRPDIINLLMQARDNKKGKSSISPEDVTAQAFIFLLGGFESPATTMSFASYLLALNPDVQRKLQAEIDQVLEENSGEISYEDLHAMRYLDAVVNETLRLYPPAAFLDRVASKSFTLPPALEGLEPFEIKPDTHIFIPTFSIHRDPKYFPDPEKFDPERFNDENKSGINPLTYLPFGIGPRICIANRFALMEVKLALFHLLAKCNLLSTPKTQSPIKLSPKTLFLMPENGFWIKIEPRK